MSMSEWFAAVVAPQKEEFARREWNRKGYESVLLLNRVFRRANRFCREKREKSYPLMPGYLFVALDPQDGRHWRDLFATPCVRGVLAVSGRPYIIPPKDVSWLKNHVWSAPLAHRYMRTHKEFSAGQTVRLAAGPLKDIEARVVELDIENRRARLDGIDFMGAEIWAPLDGLEAA